MISLFVILALALTTEPAPDLQACAKAVGATETAERLAALPLAIREQLTQRVRTRGEKLADSGAKLRETDAPTDVEKRYANARFEGGMLARGIWFVQVKQGQFGVLTYSYFPRENGDFFYSPVHSFRGPSCASIQAALAGVTAVQGL